MKDDLELYYRDLEAWLEEIGFGMGDIETNPKTGERFVASYNPKTSEKEEVFILPQEFQHLPLPVEVEEDIEDEDLTDDYDEE